MKFAYSLAGTWCCRLDPDRRGIQDNWQDGVSEEYGVTLPGTTQTNGIGPAPAIRQISNLTPATEYVGPAWYWRNIDLPDDPSSLFWELSLERVCWESFVWLNGVPLGTRDSLTSPHVYDLGQAVKSGRNRLVIMVDNANLRSASTNFATTLAEDEELVIEANADKRLHCGGHHTIFGGFVWNGITGAIELRGRPRVRITYPQVYPDVERKCVVVKCYTINADDAPVSAVLHVRVGAQVLTNHLTVSPGETPISVEVSLGQDLQLWNVHTPACYRLAIQLASSYGVDEHHTTFGMRSLSSIDNQFAINGKKVFLRGALEKFVHPISGFPPTDVSYWLGIFSVYREHGLNHLRFHSCCPPDAAFTAADQLGIILNVELPGASGEEPDDASTQAYLQSEAIGMLDAFGNHPSFCMLTMGNEILTDEVAEQKAQSRLMARVDRCRQYDPRRWYCSTAHAYTAGRNDDFYVTAWPNGPTADARHHGEPLRGFRWNGGDVVDDSRFNTRAPETMLDYRDGIAGIDKPVITHEVGMWAVYPDIYEAPRFTGVMKAFNLDIIRDFMKSKGTYHLAQDFVRASGALSLLLYKEEIESALRTPGLSGFQLLGIHDHPPQGTSTIGMLTALRESKGMIAPEGFRSFCGDTVPLVRLSKRTYTLDEVLTAAVEIFHYGPVDLPEVTVQWRLYSTSEDRCIAGHFKTRNLPSGTCTYMGQIEADLSTFRTPSKLCLAVSLQEGDIRNTWDCWVFPMASSSAEEVEGVLYAHHWSADLASALQSGETAILELGSKQIPGAIRGCFTTLLWNPIMKRKHVSQTMGILCDPTHAAFAAFPTESHSNWHWWEILRPSRVLNFDHMSAQPKPIIRMVDSFIGNRCLGLVAEMKMGKGRLLLTSLDLSHALEERHAARQLRMSLLAYVKSAAFQPELTVKPEDIDRLIASHQHEPIMLGRAELIAQFDQPNDKTIIREDNQPCQEHYVSN